MREREARLGTEVCEANECRSLDPKEGGCT